MRLQDDVKIFPVDANRKLPILLIEVCRHHRVASGWCAGNEHWHLVAPFRLISDDL